MKKFLATISLLFAMIFGLSAFGACKGDKSDLQAVNAKTTVNKRVKSFFIRISPFWLKQPYFVLILHAL